MKVRFKKLVREATVPTKAHPTDAGYDLTCVSFDTDYYGFTYHTGIALEIPEGYCGLIYPRSSVSKYDLALANCVGVIDCAYRGEIILKFRRTQPFRKAYVKGDRIGQLMIVPCFDVEFESVKSLTDSDRGEGGFGSTGE